MEPGITKPPEPAPRPEPFPHRVTATNMLLLASVVMLGWLLLPLWEPVLFAAILAATLVRWQRKLALRLGDRKYLAASVMSVGVVTLILTPLSFLAVTAARQAFETLGWIRYALDHGGLRELIRPLPNGIERALARLLERLPRGIRSLPQSQEAGRWAADQVSTVVTTVSEFAFDLAMMLIALFFLLADGQRLVDWVKHVSPLGRARTDELLGEFRLVSRAIVGSNFITGIVQAAVAMIGYLISGVPQPLFFGMLTLLSSFIPSVGTALVSLPLAGLLALTGHNWGALFLAVWSILVVGLVDNFLRPYLIRGDLHVHGALVFFSLIGGLTVFGVAGLMVGPMALVLFLTTMRFYERDVRNARAAKNP